MNKQRNLLIRVQQQLIVLDIPFKKHWALKLIHVVKYLLASECRFTLG